MEKIYEGGDAKPVWQSKTIWANFILALVSFFPQFRDLVTPEHLGTLFAVVNAGLRFVTKSGIRLR